MQKELGGKYILKEKIGSGGSGTVYKAYDRHLDCAVAMKQFQDEDTMAQEELDWMKELQHPAFPTILDYVEDADVKYLVMEYIDGIPLLEYIEEHGTVEQEQAVQWALELADALLYLHERKTPVIYRDMKPANVLIDKTGRVRLIDFGTVCLRYREGGAECRCAGTKGYAAPEQLEGSTWKLVDERCDVYGLGATLFHMLTGCNPSKPPFLILAIRVYNRSLSAGLEKIVRKATASDREKRYATVRRLKLELMKYREKDRHREALEAIAETLYYVGIAGGSLRFWWVWAELERRQPQLYGELHNRIREGRELDLLATAIGLLLLCFGKCLWDKWRSRGSGVIRQERNVVLTEKKGMGIWQVLIPVVLAAGIMTGQSRAATEENTLFVNVRNEKGQKLLIRYDTEYTLTEVLRLELPLDNFEEGERYELRLECTNRETGESHSRIFYLKGLEP